MMRNLRPLGLSVISMLLFGLSLSMQAEADEIRPALLDIKQQNTGLFAVTWKVPTRGNRVLPITPQLPASLSVLGSPTLQEVPGAQIVHTPRTGVMVSR